MADIFLSYDRDDEAIASRLVEALEAEGWSVFWDRSIRTGTSWSRVIEEQIAAASCVIVLWSQHSVASDWVRAEARDGKRRNALFPALIEHVTIPLEFSSVQAADLIDWKAGARHAGWSRLCADLRAALSGQPPDPLRPPSPPVPRRRRFEFLGSFGLAGLTLQLKILATVAVVIIGVFLVPVFRGDLARAPVQPARDGPPPSETSTVLVAPEMAPTANGGNAPPTNASSTAGPRGRGSALPESPADAKSSPPALKPTPEAPPVVPPVTAVPDEMSLRLAVRAYADALTSGNPEAVRRVYPEVSDGELREVQSLRDNFGQDRYTMSIIVTGIAIRGDEADVRARVFHNGLDDSGKPFQRERPETLRYAWNGSTWVRTR